MSESRTKFAIKNISFGMAGKLLLIFLEFISRAVFIKYIGEELLGINGVFANIIQMLALAELGMNNVVGYSFYKPIADHDDRKIAALVRFYKRIYNGIAASVLAIGILLTPFLKWIVNTKVPVDNLYIIYFIFLADTVFSYFFVYKATLLRSDQKAYIATQYEMISDIIRVVLQIIGMYIFKSIEIYLITKVVISVGKNYITAKRVDKDYKETLTSKGELELEEKKDIATTIKSGFIYKVSGTLLNSTDNIIISTMVGTIWVGLLANYLTIINGLSSFYTIIFTNLTAGVGNLVFTENKEKRLSVFNMMLMVSSWMAIVFSICLFTLSDEFVTIWIGKRFVLDKSIVLSKSIMLFLSCSLQPLFSYREALGLYKKTKYVMLIAAIENIILSIIMGYIWGVAGILYASIISMVTTYIWYEPRILYKDCFEMKSSVYFKMRICEFVLGLLGLFVFDKLSGLYVCTNWTQWIIKAGLVFIIVNIYCLAIFGRRKEFKELCNGLKGKLDMKRR